MRALMVDNYDSFTYNLVHLIGGLGVELDVYRNDKIDLDAIEEMAPEAIFISPGPCTPKEAGICVPLIEKFYQNVPIFGVCLGMQSMAAALGGQVVETPKQMHGKTSQIKHLSKGVFRGINQEFVATRYHSLMVQEQNLPTCFEPTAHASDDGVLMGVQHVDAPLHGVQFHPESIASQNGARLIENFLDIARTFNATRKQA